MAIYTDGQHVVSDTSLAELHKWARLRGLSVRRFHRGRWPHYDMPRYWNVDLGWQRTTSRGLIEAMRNGSIFPEIRRERSRQRAKAQGGAQ